MIFAAIAGWVESEEFTVEFMCAELNVSRSGYYAWRGRAPSARSVRDTELSMLITVLHATSRGNAGVRRIHADLAQLQRRVSRKRVHKLMRTAGLQGRHPKAWKQTTIRGHDPVPVPDLLGQDFTATAPNQRWVGDITYIKTWEGWAYTATVIDLFSRKIVGWACADHMRTSLVTDALTMAMTHRNPTGPVIFHSDRGTQY
nr:IS3 family transposase [Actinomycetota bacterium]